MKDNAGNTFYWERNNSILSLFALIYLLYSLAITLDILELENHLVYVRLPLTLYQYFSERMPINKQLICCFMKQLFTTCLSLLPV